MSEETPVMTTQLFYTAPTHDPKLSLGVEKSAIYGGYGATAQPQLTLADLHTLFQQLAHSLTVLGGVCNLVLEASDTTTSSQALRVWLQPHARQAERAMHQLRDMRFTKSASLTELSQSLTVLVLAADMLAQGQLSGDDALAFYGLLRRNSATATRSLMELRVQFDPEAQAILQ
jgi:hypothetical protein